MAAGAGCSGAGASEIRRDLVAQNVAQSGRSKRDRPADALSPDGGVGRPVGRPWQPWGRGDSYNSKLLAALGAHPGELTRAHLEALVAGSVCESYDLDFKGEMYGSSDASKRDLATDVAALANTAGDVIIIGVLEDERSLATSLHSVAIGDAEVRRLRQIVANSVAPIPDFEIFLVPDSEGASQGFVVISVARSLAAPHAVAVNEGWRYPRRNGSTTRYLSEPEVAQAYRDRLAGLSRRRDRLQRVWGQGIESLDASASVWVAVALVPDMPGTMTQDGPAWRRWDSFVRGRRMTLVGQSTSGCRPP